MSMSTTISEKSKCDRQAERQTSMNLFTSHKTLRRDIQLELSKKSTNFINSIIFEEYFPRFQTGIRKIVKVTAL